MKLIGKDIQKTGKHKEVSSVLSPQNWAAAVILNAIYMFSQLYQPWDPKDFKKSSTLASPEEKPYLPIFLLGSRRWTLIARALGFCSIPLCISSAYPATRHKCMYTYVTRLSPRTPEVLEHTVQHLEMRKRKEVGPFSARTVLRAHLSTV